jgi:hypothetical protein
MSEDYIILSLVMFVAGVSLVSYLLLIIEGEINERHEVR